jgi:membrane fusion protein (multidrug efflux system)
VKDQDDYDLADATYERYQGLAQTGGVTQQQLDERRSTFTQAKSTLAGAKANVLMDQAAVDRLAALTGFEKVAAPFTGTITARNYDVGALLNAANNTAGVELFRIADTAVLRVFVNVPQVYVASIKTGQPAYISVSNFPGKEFVGTVTRTAGALNANTRTLRYEIDYQNKDNQLYAGMYAQARLQVTTPTPPMVVSGSALIFDSGGTKVWVVVDGKSQSKKVVVGRDFGTEVEIASGLDGSESVVTNPGLWLADGAQVQVLNSQQPLADNNGAKPDQNNATADAKQH